jgi:hypothetical protein
MEKDNNDSCYMDEDELEDRMPNRIILSDEEIREMNEMDWWYDPDNY